MDCITSALEDLEKIMVKARQKLKESFSDYAGKELDEISERLKKKYGNLKWPEGTIYYVPKSFFFENSKTVDIDSDDEVIIMTKNDDGIYRMS